MWVRQNRFVGIYWKGLQGKNYSTRRHSENCHSTDSPDFPDQSIAKTFWIFSFLWRQLKKLIARQKLFDWHSTESPDLPCLYTFTFTWKYFWDVLSRNKVCPSFHSEETSSSSSSKLITIPVVNYQWSAQWLIWLIHQRLEWRWGEVGGFVHWLRQTSYLSNWKVEKKKFQSAPQNLPRKVKTEIK